MRAHKFPFILVFTLALIGLTTGWSLRALSFNKDALPGQEASAKTTSSRIRALPTAATAGVPISFSSQNLGSYEIAANGSRTYAGPRDITVLNRLSSLHPHDMMGLVEMMGQVSQMSAEELATAWAEFSLTDPGGGLASQLLAVQVATRLRAAGIEFEMPGGWAQAETMLPEAFAIDEVRRNPAVFREKLMAGEELGSGQRQALIRSLAIEDSAAAASLWIQHSTSEQLSQEADDLAFLLRDPLARKPLLDLMTNPTTDPELQSHLISSLGSEWAAQDVDSFEAWLDETDNVKLKRDAGFIILNARSDTDATSGVRFAQTLGEGMRTDGLIQAVESLVHYDWQAGPDLLAEITNPTDRKAALQGFGYMMAVERPGEFTKWRETLPTAEQDFVNENAFSFFAQNEPDNAQDWLARQPESQKKENLKVELMRSYAGRSSDERLVLLETITDPEARRMAAGEALRNLDPTRLEEIQGILDVALNKPAQDPSE